MNILKIIDKIARVIGLTILFLSALIAGSALAGFLSRFISGKIQESLSMFYSVISPFYNNIVTLVIIFFILLYILVFFGNIYRRKLINKD